MNNIKNYIIEKLKINSKTKISKYSSKLSKQQEEKTIEELCRYFQDRRKYKGVEYNTGLEVLDKYFDGFISNFLDYYQGDYDNLAEIVDASVHDVAEFIISCNDEIYKEIKDFVLL